MKLQKNDGGGTSIILSEGDLLSSVPESHVDILTPEIQTVFEDPVRFFNEIARRTPIANLCRYLDEMTSGGEWRLVLADTYMPVRQTIGGILLTHPNLSTPLISPATSRSVSGPFSVLYNDVGAVLWNKVAWSGGLFDFSDHIRLDHYGVSSEDARFPVSSTRAFGNSTCGDVMIYNTEGFAGFLSHENGKVYGVLTILDMLDWIFGELAEGRLPELNYDGFWTI